MADFYATRGLPWRLNRERAEALLDIQLRSAFASMPNKLPGWEKDIEELKQRELKLAEYTEELCAMMDWK